MRHRTNCRRRTTNAAVTVTVTETENAAFTCSYMNEVWLAWLLICWPDRVVHSSLYNRHCNFWTRIKTETDEMPKAHKSAKIHAGMFYDSWPWPLSFLPPNKWVCRTHCRTFACQVWWSSASVFEISCEKQTNSKPYPRDCSGVANYADKHWTTKARSTPATMSKQVKQHLTLLPKTATMSNELCVEISYFRQSRRLLRHCCWCGQGLTVHFILFSYFRLKLIDSDRPQLRHW